MRLSSERRACLGRKTRTETLEPRHLLAAQPILSEFVASNDSTLSDGFGDDSDWIEIRNAGDEALDLAGYHLTDKADDPTKWAFPASTLLGPDEYLVVFASGEDTVDPLGYWHTNFKLSAGGEYVGLAEPGGATLSEFNAGGEEYPPQLTDISYGRGGGLATTLFAASDSYSYQVPNNSGLGTTWTEVAFNAAANGFGTGSGGLGYEDSPGSTINYNNEIQTYVSTNTTSAYIRREFDLDSASDVQTLTLSLTYDDGFAAYLNGTYLFGVNNPASLTHNSVANGGRQDAEVLLPSEFSLNDYLPLLQDGPNVLAFHALNEMNGVKSSDMLLVAGLTASIEASSSGQIGYLASATPGEANTQRIDLGPIIDEVEFTPESAAPGTPIVVTAQIAPSDFPVVASTARLHYRRMFDAEASVVMLDNGTGADEEAGDGVFTATIPGLAQVGEMIRWYVTAEDTEGTLGRAPRFANPVDSAEYFGTVVADPSASDDLPVMYWFVEDEAAAQTRPGTRASLYYLGEFYDNIQVDLHGQSTASDDFPKKSFDFDSNTGQKFKIAEGLNRHSDFNLLTNYADQSKLRHSTAYGAFAEAGAAHHLAFPISIHRNGEFYALYDFVEDGDTEYLERLGLDPDGALYKVNNNLEDSNSAIVNVEKKSREYEDRSDLEEVVQADDLTGFAATQWDYDNLDMASVVNYLAMQTIVANNDFGHKNQYLYRDSNETELWQFLVWDLDLSFGHRWNPNVSPPYFDDALITTTNPFFGFNDIIQRLYQDTNFREMYFRRIRTLSDQILGVPGTPLSESWVWQQFEQGDALAADEAVQDAAEWGIHPNFNRTPTQAIDQIQNTFIPDRRNYLTGLGYIPNAQAGPLDVAFEALAPTTGDGPGGEEYFVLKNHESTAVDISGWSVAGSANHTLKSGTVIPAGEKLYVLADVQGFQARTYGPRGGQALMIQGNYGGGLSPYGGTLSLSNAQQDLVAQLDYAGSRLAGDFNGDGSVGAADYTVWRDAVGAEYSLAADGNADGGVDDLDRVLWAANYGAVALVTIADSASAVSTPTNASLQVIAAGVSEAASDIDQQFAVVPVVESNAASYRIRRTGRTATRAETLAKEEALLLVLRDNGAGQSPAATDLHSIETELNDREAGKMPPDHVVEEECPIRIDR